MVTNDTTAYLIFLCAGFLVCFLLFALRAGGVMKLSGRRAGVLGLVSLGLSIPLGLLGAKALYFLFRFDYMLKLGIGSSLFSLKAEELSWYGGAFGVGLAVFLAAKILGEKPSKVLNAFAFPGALLAAVARFGEYWLGYLGTGSYLENPLPFPFAVSDMWNPDFPEYYLAVFMLEGIVYLRVALFAWQRRKDPLCFVRTVFYLCLSQIICESMRAQSIRWLFVRYEQLLCYLVAEGILVWYGIAGRKRGTWTWGAAIFGILLCALTVLEEFMLDGKVTWGEYDLPSVLIYVLMAWGLLETAVLEHGTRRKLEAAGL